ncbi:MAG: site-specific DNA-methyltransferase [Acidobacteriota bacterium]|nr:site-specific DNA-methyltransferase [Acidobacteriota bacterium]
MNRLYYGDCLTIMRDHLPARSVDLIYLDPPFNSNQEYNAIYKTETGMPLPDQVEAFCDTWTLDPERERAIRRAPVLMREAGIDDAVAQFWQLWMDALRKTQPRLLAYLSYMVERLLHMRVVLRPNGSIYLHCDPTASHYMKALMDAVFGHQNFRNEIIWKRTSAHSSARRFGPVHDVILFYSKSQNYKWNRVFQPYDTEYVQKFYRHQDDRGLYTMGDLTGSGVRRVIRASRGVVMTQHKRGDTGRYPGGFRAGHWSPMLSMTDWTTWTALAASIGPPRAKEFRGSNDI